jgi:hypothetical protein
MDLNFFENDILCQNNIFFEFFLKSIPNNSNNVFQKAVTKTIIKEVDVVHVILFMP